MIQIQANILNCKEYYFKLGGTKNEIINTNEWILRLYDPAS